MPPTVTITEREAPLAIEFHNEHGKVILEQHSKDSHVAGMRVLLYPGEESHGYGTELVRHALSKAPDYGIHRVEATPYTDNPRSTAFFAEHLKDLFVHEGTKKDAGHRDNGKFVDTHLFAWTSGPESR